MFCLFSCWLYGALSYALLFSLHLVCALDMHISLYYCASLNACLDDHLLCYVIIVVISIWLFGVWSSCSHVSHHVYLIAIYLLHYTCPFITCFTLRVKCVLYKCFRLQVYMFPVHHSFSSFWRGETLNTFSLYCLSFYSI